VRKALLAAALGVGLVVAAPAWAVAPGANGKLLYTMQTPGNFDIWTINADGSGNVPIITDSASDQGGSWSPDGTKIVFRSDRTNAGDIYIADANGANQLQLTSDPGKESHPSFSPDGKKIAFTRADPDDEIWVMNADGSDAHRLTDNTIADAGPDWSPDGTRIAYFSSNVIHVMNADGTNQHELVPGGSSVGPQWSPDARRVLFNRNDGPSAGSHTYVVNADGTGLVKVGPATPNSQAPSWSPDGTKIVFLSSGTESGIWIMNADGSGAAPILDDALVRSGPRWQPIPRAPTALTQAPTDVTPLAAKLNGTIDSTVLHPTTYWFEYGTTTAYGTRTADFSAPFPVGQQAVSADLTNLQTSVTYHVRLVARNAIGTTTGADQTFRTNRARPTSLTTRVRPRRDRTLPFRYVVRGRLGLPSVVPAANGCRGRVLIRVKRGKRTVLTRRARLSSSCRYRRVIAFKSTRRLRASKGRLKVRVVFRGNTVLLSRRGPARFVRFG
jgi:Tol biopolymer transport system component